MSDSAHRLVTLADADRVAIQARLHRREVTPRVRERLEMVKAADLGHDLAAIAAWSGRSEKTVRRWLRRFIEAGVAGLTDAPRPGRPKHTLGHLQDAGEVARCEAELAQVGGKGGGGTRALRVAPPG